MKIDKITPQLFVQNNAQIKGQQPVQVEEKEQNYVTASAQNYIGYQPNFTGGYSLDLAETIANLDKLAVKYPNIYPKQVREWLFRILPWLCRLLYIPHPASHHSRNLLTWILRNNAGIQGNPCRTLP